jgi:hypothetical protein
MEFAILKKDELSFFTEKNGFSRMKGSRNEEFPINTVCLAPGSAPLCARNRKRRGFGIGAKPQGKSASSPLAAPSSKRAPPFAREELAEEKPTVVFSFQGFDPPAL